MVPKCIERAGLVCTVPGTHVLEEGEFDGSGGLDLDFAE